MKLTMILMGFSGLMAFAFYCCIRVGAESDRHIQMSFEEYLERQNHDSLQTVQTEEEPSRDDLSAVCDDN